MKPVGLAMGVLLVAGIWVGQGFSQASAEAVLTHGLGSGTASTLGKTLGNALGNAAGQMGSRLGQQTSIVPRRQRVPNTSTTSVAAPGFATAAAGIAPMSGSLIMSIQGGVSLADSASGSCSPGANAATSSAKADASASPPKEKVPPSSSACALGQDDSSHPAVVNLPPAY